MLHLYRHIPKDLKMKKFVLILALAAVTCGRTTVDVERIASLAAGQALLMEKSLTDDVMPRTFRDGAVVISNLEWWCSGFYPGVCWYTYLLGGDQAVKELALRQTARLQDVEKLNDSHDVGFQVMCSSALAYKVTGDSLYLNTIREGAEKLAARFSPVTGAIKSWNWDSYPVIIDNMMNLELLTYAAGLFDQPSWREIAITHARTTMANHFRENGSCYHLVDFNPEDGIVMKKQTVQGYADESAWARGQAWALYGFTMMYRETGLAEFLEQAERVAAYLLPLLEKQPIPNWDFDAPQKQVDASAGAIMASAFLELGALSQNPDYRHIAERILKELCSAEYLCQPGECAGFLLKHSTGHFTAASEVDVPLTYADYYFLEALYRWKTASATTMPSRLTEFQTASSTSIPKVPMATASDGPATTTLSLQYVTR